MGDIQYCKPFALSRAIKCGEKVLMLLDVINILTWVGYLNLLDVQSVTVTQFLCL